MKGNATTHSLTPVTPMGLAMLMAAVMARPTHTSKSPVTRRQGATSTPPDLPMRSKRAKAIMSGNNATM